jgi:hypothetical protein
MLSSNTCVSDDPARGGCEFSRFFLTTPSDLIEDGLYKVLAFAAYPAAKHRKVSLMLLAMSLGATDVTHSIEKTWPEFAACGGWGCQACRLSRTRRPIVGQRRLGELQIRLQRVARTNPPLKSCLVFRCSCRAVSSPIGTRVIRGHDGVNTGTCAAQSVHAKLLAESPALLCLCSGVRATVSASLNRKILRKNGYV